MAQYFLEAEERRRVSMALALREQSAVRFAQLRRLLSVLSVNAVHKPVARETARGLFRRAR